MRKARFISLNLAALIIIVTLCFPQVTVQADTVQVFFAREISSLGGADIFLDFSSRY